MLGFVLSVLCCGLRGVCVMGVVSCALCGLCSVLRVELCTVRVVLFVV